jgi:hypothetical protein
MLRSLYTRAEDEIRTKRTRAQAVRSRTRLLPLSSGTYTEHSEYGARPACRSTWIMHAYT